MSTAKLPQYTTVAVKRAFFKFFTVCTKTAVDFTWLLIALYERRIQAHQFANFLNELFPCIAVRTESSVTCPYMSGNIEETPLISPLSVSGAAFVLNGLPDTQNFNTIIST